jgi:hypothetical protein
MRVLDQTLVQFLMEVRRAIQGHSVNCTRTKKIHGICRECDCQAITFSNYLHTRTKSTLEESQYSII